MFFIFHGSNGFRLGSRSRLIIFGSYLDTEVVISCSYGVQSSIMQIISVLF
jgi:hypothetical protein